MPSRRHWQKSKQETSIENDSPFSDEEISRHSGTGILEFSPDKAGQDVTPANFDFKDGVRVNDGAFTALTGKYIAF